MGSEIGRGAQVSLNGISQGAARGAIASSQIENEIARNDATPIDNLGTPAPADVAPSEDPFPGGTVPNSLVAEPFIKAANDVDAGAKGVPIGGFYMNTAGVQQRQA
jgi:hypothetical protein